MKKSVIIVLGILLLLPLASAGFLDLFSITGKLAAQNEDLNISIGNSDPEVTYVSFGGGTVTSVEDTAVATTFSVHVYDHDGVADIDDSGTVANFTLAGEETRQDTSCTLIGDLADGNTANYTCTVTMEWFDAASASWEIHVVGTDVNGSTGLNDTSTFTYTETTAFVMAPVDLTWDEIAPGADDSLSNNDPLLINNTGNDAIAAGSISVNATDLLGETDASLGMNSENFSVNPSDACSSGIDMINNTNVSITGAALPAGNYTVGDGSTGAEQLYFCLEHAGTDLIKQAYSTAPTRSWVVKIHT